MSITREHIYLAALLHDIGKFYQRADGQITDVIGSNEYYNNLAELICPVNEHGRWGYQHVFWTCKFLEEHATKLNKITDEHGNKIFAINNYDGRNDDNLINLSIFHHKPQTKLQAIIQLADWWSSGMERTNANFEMEESPEYGKYKYKKVPLKSIFNFINEPKGNSAFELNKLSLEDNCFPDDELLKQDFRTTDKGVFEKKYKQLWDNFVDDFESLPFDSYTGFTESLYYLLKQYTWCIPASTTDLAHVSLFEHLKTTAAIADCLFVYETKNPGTFNWDESIRYPKIKEGAFPLLMVCWDVSGIQNFIYNIAGTKAAVSLKGRSFYLQLLVETVIQKTIINCNATWGHVIYSSGGKLFMLLPNLDEVKQALEKIHAEFETELWNEHKGKLYLCLGITPFSFNSKSKLVLFEDGTSDALGVLWKKTVEAASKNKSRKYLSLFLSESNSENRIDGFAEMFTPSGNWQKGDDYKLCAVTGDEGVKNKTLVEIKKGEDVWVTKNVKEQADLGLALKDADYLITYLKEDDDGMKYLKSKQAFRFSIGDTGIHHYLFDKKQLTLDDADFRKITSADVARVRGINELNFTHYAKLKGNKCSYGYLYYGGNKQALKLNKEEKTFEQLCEVEKDGNSSNTFLGVLRMDVDGLGKIFINGIPNELKSFATYATLSSQLDWFFSGYLNTIRNGEKFKNHVNILYSGGDDVFAIGRWDKIVDFADDIRNKFRAFVGRDDISISGGISIVGEKFPIRLGAELAGEAEEEAKNFNNGEKNALNLFGQTITWKQNSEWDEVKELKEKLVAFISKENGLSSAILHQLISWKTIKDKTEKDLSYKWHTAYYLKRYKSKYENGGDNKNELSNFLNELTQSLFTGQGQFIQIQFGSDRYYDLAALAARWAEMEIKEIIH